ncbi:MFS transporter, partial [Streptomyces cavourensis]
MVDLVSHPPQVPLPPSDSEPVSSAADASHGAGPGDAPPRGRTRPVGRVRTLLSRSVADTRPLSTAAFRRTFVGQSVSVIGLMASSVAVPVELYALTHSSAVVGVSGLVGLVPTVVFGLYGGAVADAVDRRKLYLGSCWLTWIVSLALMVQSLLHVRSPALILILVAVQSGGFAVSSSVRGAIVPRLVPTGQISAANGLLYSVGNLGQVLGPLLAGVLLGLPGGFALVYGADAVLFTVALYAAFR